VKLPRLSVVLLIAAAPLMAQRPVEPPTLEPGKRIEFELAAREAKDHYFVLHAGQYARIDVRQYTINVAVVVFDPAGQQLFTVNNNSIGEFEDAELIAATSGIYRARVMAFEAHAPTGRYDITLRDVSLSTQRQKLRVAATCELAIATAANRKATREAMLDAIRHFEAARGHWRAAGDALEEARTLYTMGFAYIELGDRDKALAHTTEALAIARVAGDGWLLGRVLDSVGEVYNNFGDKKAAMPYYEEALSLMRATGDRAGEGKTLSNLGVAYSLTGNRPKALELFDEAKRILREVQDRRALAEVCGNMGVTYDNMGEYQLALENHQYELRLRREMGDRAGEGVTQNNIGSAYSGLAAYQKALDAYLSALEINRSNDHRWNMAINLNNIGWVYANLGDRSHALTSYQESLQLSRSIKDRRRIAVSLNNIANIYADLGNYRRAIALHSEALALRRATSDPDGEATSLTNLGDAYAKLGETEKAREHLERGLAILRVTLNRHKLVRTLRDLGTLCRKAGEYDRALAYLDEALGISREIQDRNGEASVLAEMARVFYGRGDLSSAHQLAEQSLAAFESLRLRVLSPSLRASLVASVRQVHELNIDILERLHAQQPANGYDARALRTAERGRARSLLDLLGESTAEIRRGVDTRLLARERELQRVIADKADRQIRLLNTAHSAQQAAEAARELDSLGAEIEQVQSRIREASPKYAALTQPTPLDLHDIQSRVLDRDTVLLEYELGAERSFLWVVTSSSLATFELPPRAAIESAARKVYELLAARNQRPASETGDAWAARVRRSDLTYFGAAAKVSRMLLGPVSSLIAKKRLLIVAEGALQSLPFAALPEPGKRSPLIVEHEIVTAPSASVIAVLRQESASRKPPDKTLFVVADPVFSASDTRVGQQNTFLSTAAMRPVVDRGMLDFVRLRFTRAEAEDISSITPAAATRKVFDFEASRDTVMSPDISRYRIVHFATHSILDNEHPDLSGVVLSLVDRNGRRQNGFLRLYDIYNLRLRADLVVLSAFRTALGGDMQSEGLIGLTRGFFYAGSPRVLATLWEVDDRTSARLMKQFYERMLVAGETPAAALRAAQVAMWQTKGWEAPYYWAAFTLQGEWR